MPRYASILDAMLFIGVALGSLISFIIRSKKARIILTITLLVSLLAQGISVRLFLLLIERFFIGFSFGALFILSKNNDEIATITPIMWDLGAITATIIYTLLTPTMWGLALSLVAILGFILLIDVNEDVVLIRKHDRKYRLNGWSLLSITLSGIMFEVLATSESTLNANLIASYLKISPVELLLVIEASVIVPVGLLASVITNKVSLPIMQIIGFTISGIAILMMLLLPEDVRISFITYIIANASLQLGPGTTIYAEIFNTRRAIVLVSFTSNVAIALITFYPIDALWSLAGVSIIGALATLPLTFVNLRESKKVMPIIIPTYGHRQGK